MSRLTSFRRQLSIVLALAIMLSTFIGSFVNASQNPPDSASGSSATVTSSTYSKIELLSSTPNSLLLAPDSTQIFTLMAYDFSGTPVQIAANQVVWQADSSIGTISASGVFTAAAVASGFAHGYVHAAFDGLAADSLVLVGNNVTTVLEDFESKVKNGITVVTSDRLPAGSAVSSVVDVVDRSTNPVLYGNGSAKLTYNMLTGPSGTVATYVSLRNLTTGALDRLISGTPKKIGVWVYGDQGNHWLRARLRNGSNTAFTIDFTTGSGFNWKGWKYVTADIPTNQTGPFKFMDLYLVETNDANKSAGVIYYDQLSLFYTNTSTFGLDIQGLTPMKVGETKTAQAYATKKDSLAPELVTSGVTYLSSRPDIATVNSNGQVTALKSGKSSIVAIYADAQPAVFELEVSDTQPAVASIQLFGPATLEAGRSSGVQLMAKYASFPSPLDVTTDNKVILSSSNPAVAVFESGNKLKALRPGTSTISASFGGQAASIQVTVIPPVSVLSQIQLINMQSLTVGSTLHAAVNAVYTIIDQPQPPVPLEQGVAFKSSNTTVADIDVSGLISAKNIGVSVITATYGGKIATYALVVNGAKSPPKREMRAAWVSSIENIDWPKKGVFDANQQRQDFKDMLDNLAATGINTIITQIRPSSDAFYPSKLNPWSEWLTGTSGVDPGYDPLAFMIEEAHKRNIEFHAWFNPYRIRNDLEASKLAANSPAKLHPEWVVSYGGKLGYNPGIPAVKTYIIDSVMEVVKNYDIDGVHFDDYFYPYPVTGVDYPDNNEYAQYGAGLSRDDWRRKNVDSLIQELSQQIKHEKSYVKFGISPFGIWRNKSATPAGSDTNGLQSYDTIYADSVKWIQQSWIDYVTPQLYWYINYGPAAYEKLVDWWKEQVKGKNVNFYTGNGVYRVGESDPNWQDPEQIPNQIKYNRNFSDVKGSILFSTSHLLSNPLNVRDNLKNNLFRYPALPPQMSWLDSVAPTAIQGLSAKSIRSGVELRWNDKQEDTAYYVIYRAQGEGAPNIDDPAAILKQVRKQPGEAQTIVDASAAASVKYTYLVIAVDRLHNESPASDSVSLTYIQPDVEVDPTEPSTSPGSNEPSSPSVPVAPPVTTLPASTVQTFEASDLPSADGTQVTLAIKSNVDTVHLPGNTASVIGSSKDLVLRFDALSVVIPSSVLSAAEQIAQSKGSASKLIFSAVPVKGAQQDALTAKAQDQQGANLQAAAVYNFKLTIQKPDGTSEELHKFTEPLRFTFVVPQGINPSKAQVYYVADNGALQYVGGQLSSDRLTLSADISHFSTYAVFEFNKKYNDLDIGHWAYPAIDDLSRKLIVNGVDSSSYDPERSVTRAEFAALLVRALGLKEASTLTYQDVKSSDWFAAEVAIAHKSGIVTGMTDDTFQPNGTVSREQMAVMLVRAYSIKQGKALEPAAEPKFSDFSDVQSWAKPFVSQANQLGLLTGKEHNLFDPSAALNRAESAQAIFNLLSLGK